MAACCPINYEEIAILGGISFDEMDEASVLGDVVLFNLTTNLVERRVNDVPGLLQFCSFGNQVCPVGDDTVVVLAMDEDKGKVKAVQYKKGTRMLKSLGAIA